MSAFAKAREKQRARTANYRDQLKGFRPAEIALLDQRDTGVFSGLAKQTSHQESLYTHFRETLHTVIDVIATQVAAQCPRAGEVIQGSRTTRRSIGSERWVNKSLVPHKISEKAAAGDIANIVSHPALDVLKNPNKDQPKSAFLYMLAANYLITGECYIVGGICDETNELKLYAFPTSWIEPIHDGAPFTSYKLQAPGSTEQEFLSPENVVRIYKPDPTDPKCAYSTVKALSTSLRIDNAIDNTQDRMFSQGIHPFCGGNCRRQDWPQRSEPWQATLEGCSASAD